MSDLGQYLKEQRKEQGLSLDDIQEMTKIRKRYLEAIEKGEYHVLPGAFYARAFIKSYAEALKLDPDGVFEKYAHELPSIELSSVETLPMRSSRRREGRERQNSRAKGRWVSNLIFYSFLIIIGLIIYFSVVNFIHPNTQEFIAEDKPGVNGEGQLEEPEPQGTFPQDDDDEQPTSEGKEENDPANGGQEGEQKAPAQGMEPRLTKDRTENNRTYFTYEHADRFNVRLEAKGGRVWYSLNNEETDEEIEQRELGEGEIREWDFSDLREVRFKFGNTPVVHLSINGEEVDLSGLSHVHHVIITYHPKEQ